MRIHLLIVAVCLAIPYGAAAQKKPISEKEAKAAQAKVFSYGVTTNTRSAILGGGVLRHSTSIPSREGIIQNRYISLEAVNVKHPKEYTTNAINRFIQGKTHYFFSVRPSYGRERYFFKRVADEGIGFSGIVAAGPSIGLQRPYYIKYATQPGENPQLVPYQPLIHTDPGKIVGTGSIWQNFFQNMKVLPGAHLKMALNFDANPFGDNVTGIETGFLTEYYFKRPEIMSNDLVKNQQFFASAYVTLYLGNKKLQKRAVENAN